MSNLQWLAALAAVIFFHSVNPIAAIAGNREDCLQDQDQALAAIACPLFQAELAGKKPSGATTSSEVLTGDVMAEEWLLNPGTSQISLTTVKNETVEETHVFTTLDGSVSSSGEAKVTIDLNSLETRIDIWNVRMRFLFFETFKFPAATLSAQLDPGTFTSMAVGSSVVTDLPLTLDLHGIKKELLASVAVIRISETQFKVVSTIPVIISASDFELSDGITRLSEAADNIAITPQATVTFDLSFEGGEANPQLAAARSASEQNRLVETTRTLTAEECQNRMVVISDTRQIYFASGSAVIDEAESAPVLNEVAQFFSRCPSVAMRIAGHTDSAGGNNYNNDLSERRAGAVRAAMLSRKVDASRLSAVGFGESQPVASNATAAGQAKNRRIEFNIPGLEKAAPAPTANLTPTPAKAVSRPKAVTRAKVAVPKPKAAVPKPKAAEAAPASRPSSKYKQFCASNRQCTTRQCKIGNGDDLFRKARGCKFCKLFAERCG